MAMYPINPSGAAGTGYMYQYKNVDLEQEYKALLESCRTSIHGQKCPEWIEAQENLYESLRLARSCALAVFGQECTPEQVIQVHSMVVAQMQQILFDRAESKFK